MGALMSQSMVAFLFVVLISLVLPVAVMACPTCNEALFDPEKAQQVLRAAHGYAVSIGLLLGTPLLLVGGLVLLIVRQVRRRGTTAPNRNLKPESRLTP